MTTPMPGALHADPWATSAPDLESLNSAVTDAIIESINRVHAYAGQPSRTPPAAIVATAPAGAGKTHLFGRLRRKVGVQAVLVHTRPLVGAEMTPRFLLGQVVPQLARPVWNHPDDLSQLDLVVGGALAWADRQSMLFPAACLQEVRELSEVDRRRRIDAALTRLLETDSEYDAAYLECLLEAPFAPRLAREAKLLWLAGRELSPSQGERAGLKEPLPDGSTIGALRTIAALASRTAPLVIVFDQLENLADPQGDGALVNAYGNLISELVDGVRDLVIVQLALDGEWHQRIEPGLQTSHRSRVVGARHTLALPTRDQRVQLLQLWTSQLDDPDRKPFPWPFTANQLRAVCDAPGTTPRMLWLELRRALTGEEPVAVADAAAVAQRPLEATSTLAEAWEERLAHARNHVDSRSATESGAEPAFLLDGLLLLCRITSIGPVKAHGPEMLRMEGGTGPSWIALVHQPHHLSVGAVFRRLATLQGGVLALRERAREWPPTWKTTNDQLADLRRGRSFRWHWLDRDETVRLLALSALLKDVRSGDVPGPDGKPIPLDRATAWLTSTLMPETWTVTQLIRGGTVDDGEAPPAPVAKPPEQVPAGSKPPQVPAAPGAQLPATRTTRLLSRLRVASVQRLVRDLSAEAVGITRAAVLAELRASSRVRWIGDSVVCWVD